MIVTPKDPFTYEVTSRSGKEPYHVDTCVGFFNGICLGKCDCADHSMNLRPKFVEMIKQFPEMKPSDSYRCGHLRAARQFEYDQLIGMHHMVRLKTHPELDDEF